MGKLKIGDIVARKSYGYDVFFKVVDIVNRGSEHIARLKGISYRIEADAPESDLEVQPDNRVREYRDRCWRAAESSVGEKRARERGANFHMARYRGYQKKVHSRDTSNEETGKIKIPGKVLHLDGDKDYLENCLSEYRKLGLTAVGQYVPGCSGKISRTFLF